MMIRLRMFTSGVLMSVAVLTLAITALFAPDWSRNVFVKAMKDVLRGY